jgi:hypothetical protein
MSNRDDIPGMETITLHASVFARRVCFVLLAISIGLLVYWAVGPSQEIKHLINEYVYWYGGVVLAIVAIVVIRG